MRPFSSTVENLEPAVLNLAPANIVGVVVETFCVLCNVLAKYGDVTKLLHGCAVGHHEDGAFSGRGFKYSASKDASQLQGKSPKLRLSAYESLDVPPCT